MKADDAIRRLFKLILWTGVVSLPACVQPRLARQEARSDEALASATESELARQLDAVRKYASRMEEIYAAQEAEIRALRHEVAVLESRDQ